MTDRSTISPYWCPHNSSSGRAPGGAELAPAFAFVVDVESDSGKQHEPLDDLLHITADTQDRHAVVQYAEHQTDDDRAEYRADTAGRRRRADERGSCRTGS